jgi:hypothetical protein
MPRKRVRPHKSSRSHHLPAVKAWAWLLVKSAPSGTYEIDRVIEECLRTGIFQLPAKIGEVLQPSLVGVLWHVRGSVSLTAHHAISAANGQKDMPEYRRLTEHFIKDLQLIVHLIERNQQLDPFMPNTILSPRVGPAREVYEQAEMTTAEATLHLQQTLLAASAEIRLYLEASKKTRERGGNRDPLVSEFISTMFLVPWRELTAPGYLLLEERSRIQPEHYRPFVRFLAAAWRDLGFPLADHRGHSREPLEEWFADRLRKHIRFCRKSAGYDSNPNSIDI